jgi:tRNA A-37 threonylcarbamoyl transferase component Bud32
MFFQTRNVNFECFLRFTVKTMNEDQELNELLWKANGGIRNLGWARMVTKFTGISNSITVKLYKDKSFYGRVLPETGYTEGFIFKPVNTPRNIFERVSREHFIIQREETTDVANFSPAVLHCQSRSGVFINNNFIGQGASAILETGDSIKLSLNVTLFQFFDDRQFDSKNLPSLILNKYHIDSSIGKGGQSSSVRLIHHKRLQTKYAMKIISKERYTDESIYSHTKRLEHMKNEVSIMQRLHHSNVIKFIEAFANDRDLYIVMELADQGNLLTYMQSFPGKFLPESEAKFCLYQICRGLDNIHKHDIAHRDLKVENIFIMGMNIGGKKEIVLKIGDFGYSKNITESLMTQIGTKYYLPPEIQNLQGEYTIKADIWTLGCIFYGCISGAYPFHENYGSTLSQQITTGELKFDRNSQWGVVS